MSSDGDMDDPDLRAAIAASLGNFPSEENRPNGNSHEVVDLTAEDSDSDVVPIFPKSNSVIGSETDDDEETVDGDSEDEDMKKAIALSLQDLTKDDDGPWETPDPNESSKPQNSDRPSSQQPQQPQKPTGILGLDRKQMEQERLARLAKRKAVDIPEASQPEPKHPKIEIPSASNKPQIPSTESSVQFPEGVVKKTWAFGLSRRGDDIKIEEVLQRSDLKVAVLSSFMWDMDWLFSKMDQVNTRFVFLMQAKDDATKRQYERETADMRNLKLCFPPMEGQVQCMHSKLMILFHPGHVRIVVPTANLTPYDWGEMGGVMENTVFLIDLPKLHADSERIETNFKKELIYFLQASAAYEMVTTKLNEYDFSKTAHIALVHSIGGSHVGQARVRTGHCGLGRAVDSLGLRTSRPLNIDFVTSSVGNLSDEFMRSIYFACQGDDGMIEYTFRNAKRPPHNKGTSSAPSIDDSTAKEWKDRFRTYFPSLDVVKNSKGGLPSAGTICFQSKWYKSPTFPSQVLRDCESRRPGVLMHNKLMYVRPDEPIQLPDNKQCRAWAYVGSANLSESAWGRLVQDRATKGPKLNCRNWECGVLVPVVEQVPSSETKDIEKQGSGPAATPGNKESEDMLDVFREVVPVPMVLPGKRFGGRREPWFFMETET
ncbi:tyrosyl-DNA phosphodiesterase [Aspergillus terreus]|uniref:Tyrosyl-DNA phosphodiesterase n=1 Tax=Aspergillus terreus TaxID=33178 RepID=A0A5M3Z429_ASPTE|nr:hypothetical protein ATETN484_0008016900 [Aspergillus terreus]GFF21070.1 tyrosyl-DNA phosphodiesterase [Aspergillus terreus]